MEKEKSFQDLPHNGNGFRVEDSVTAFGHVTRVDELAWAETFGKGHSALDEGWAFMFFFFFWLGRVGVWLNGRTSSF
jgi:hypothetical protein